MDCRDVILRNAVEKSTYGPVHKALYAYKNYEGFISAMQYKPGYSSV